MATSKNGKMYFESGQTFNDFEALTDSGDHTILTASGSLVFSGKSGYEVDVRPNGVVSGRNMITPHADADKVAVATFTAYSKGVEHTVSAGSVTITRPATAVAKINSITMTDAGVLAEVTGTDAADTTFVTTRGAAGGPPEIPVDSVEIGQIKMVSDTSAVILATEIFQVAGTHLERFDLPTWKTNNVGDGDSAETIARKNAYVMFDAELTAGHTGGAYKKVYASYYEPIYAEMSRAYGFVPAENTHSLSSTQYYGGTVGSTSSSLGQASFTGLMNDNVTDTLVGLRDEILTFKFLPDKNRTPYVLTQGTMGMKRTFPVDGQNQADVTISAENPSADFAS